MRFARWTFAIAGIYGLLTLIPHYFMESLVGETSPPPINHPEFYYGFVGVALAFQVLFLLIARDPVRLRPAMVPAILEKLTFAAAVLILVFNGRAGVILLLPMSVDVVLATLFVMSYFRTPDHLDPWH